MPKQYSLDEKRKRIVIDPNVQLTISEKEWKEIRDFVRKLVTPPNNRQPPFKISRTALEANFKKSFNHSILVIPDGKGEYKIGAIARAKAYFPKKGMVSKIIAHLPGTKKKEEGVLGSGGFGYVKLVQWEGEAGTSAIKIQKATNFSGPEFEKMKKLNRVQATFEGPPKLAISGEVIKKSYIVMERYSQDLWGYLDEGRRQLPDDEKYKLALAAALAIKELHDQNILHCDIKPENFMLPMPPKKDKLVAIDFGVSMELNPGEEKIIDVTLGTPAYIEPVPTTRKTINTVVFS